MTYPDSFQKLAARINQNRPVYRHKVFGIGYPKTGTTTLGYCFRRLGYKHSTYNMDLAVKVCKGDEVAAIHAAKHYESFEDWPWFLVYKPISKVYTSAKFVLTVRQDPDAYVNSLYRHRKAQGVFEPDFKEPAWWRDLFGYEPGFWDSDLFRNKYISHNESVIEHFRNKPESLLVVSWEKGDGWHELCQFLDRPLPKETFPHRNKSTT